jgi:hypothetical protein
MWSLSRQKLSLYFLFRDEVGGNGFFWRFVVSRCKNGFFIVDLKI